MLAIFKRRLTARPFGPRYPAEPATVPPGFRGMPELIAERCRGHASCAAVCPSGAIQVERWTGGWTWELDRARCLACGLCAEACPARAITISPDFELAARTRAALRTRVVLSAPFREEAP
jgi:formate hydrogenlyase subunit 6/NADH:ubiquinone oxidoreductase subunit I